MSDVGDIAEAVKSISDLADGILTRADRDAPDKEKYENITKLQNGYLSEDPDHTELGILVQLLLAKTGHTATPSRDAGIYRREIFHSLILCAIDLIHERRLAARLITALSKRTS